MQATLFSLLMCLSLTSSAAVVFVQNAPEPLTYYNDIYYWPQNLEMPPGTKNLYITMNGLQKICFLNRAPSGLFEQISEISIMIKGVRTEWNCFAYTTTIQAVRP